MTSPGQTRAPEPSAAVGAVKLVVATPLASKVIVVASSVAPLVLSVAVWPATEVAVEAQGLALSAQALTVTGVGRQARLAEGIDSS